jgi:hypothetical protein
MSDDDWDEPPLDRYEAPQIVGPSDGDDETVIAGLWLPNPETRYGWELYRVARTAPKKERRQLGFYGKRRRSADE